MKKRREEVMDAKKEETIDIYEIYERLLLRVWNKIVLILGAVTVSALLRRVIRKTTAESFSFIESLSVSNDGLDFSQLRERMAETDAKTIRDGFEELIFNFFDLLIELTGDAIVDKIFKQEILEGARE